MYFLNRCLSSQSSQILTNLPVSLLFRFFLACSLQTLNLQKPLQLSTIVPDFKGLFVQLHLTNDTLVGLLLDDGILMIRFIDLDFHIWISISLQKRHKRFGFHFFLSSYITLISTFLFRRRWNRLILILCNLLFSILNMRRWNRLVLLTMFRLDWSLRVSLISSWHFWKCLNVYYGSIDW